MAGNRGSAGRPSRLSAARRTRSISVERRLSSSILSLGLLVRVPPAGPSCRATAVEAASAGKEARMNASKSRLLNSDLLSPDGAQREERNRGGGAVLDPDLEERLIVLRRGRAPRLTQRLGQNGE